MPLRGEIDSSIPQVQESIGTDADGRPIKINEQYRRFLETLWERSGGFEDETFANDAQIADLQSAIATAGERLESLEQLIQQDRAIDAALDDLQTRLAAIESLPTIQENADVAGQIEAIQFGLQSIEEQLFTAPRGIDVVTDSDVAVGAGIQNRKIDYPAQTDTYDESGTGALAQSSGERTLLQVSFSDVGTPHFATAAGTQFKFRNDEGSGADSASAAGLTFTLRLRVGSTDMSSHSYGSNQVIFENSKLSATDGGITGFQGEGLVTILSSSIFSFPATGVTQYAALTGEVTGGSGSDEVYIEDDTTKLVITGFANIQV